MLKTFYGVQKRIIEAMGGQKEYQEHLNNLMICSGKSVPKGTPKMPVKSIKDLEQNSDKSEKQSSQKKNEKRP